MDKGVYSRTAQAIAWKVQISVFPTPAKAQCTGRVVPGGDEEDFGSLKELD